MKSIEGIILKILFQSDKTYYKVLLLHTPEKHVVVAGHFPFAYPHLRLAVYGKTKIHKRFGEQFDCESHELIEPRHSNELFHFLCSSYIGCDRTIARSITAKMGMSYLLHYENISFCASKIGPAPPLQTSLHQNRLRLNGFFEKKESLQALVQMGFSQELACKIVFSEASVDMPSIRTNPYSLIKIFDLDWNTIDAIARKNGMLPSSEIRISEALCYLLDFATEKYSHLFLPLPLLQQMINRFLGISVDAKSHLKKLESENRVIQDVNHHIYTEENYRLEKNLAHHLFRLSSQKKKTPPVTFGEDILSYSPEQKQAIQLAIKEPLSIIIGPAGTGKTTLLIKLVNELKAQKYKIQLCAPTGRAAKRMTEVTKMEAKTIHHLLLFDPYTKKPKYDSRHPLPFDCLIIDEASLLDVKIFSYLLAAAQNQTKVVIIGDTYQLPSVGPGKVLKDMCESTFFPVTELKTVYRQSAGLLLDNATKVRNGEPINLFDLPAQSDFKFFATYEVNEYLHLLKKILAVFSEKTEWDLYKDLQIISPVYNGTLGVRSLNTFVQNILNPVTPFTKEIFFGDILFRTQDKVIQKTTNYDKKVINGEIGKIIDINVRSKTTFVQFDNRLVEYDISELAEIDLGFVLTVHKSQGGEYPFVIMPLHKTFGKAMLNRNLFYTAMTRSKTQFILLSNQQTVQKTIRTQFSDKRFSNLHTRLKAARLKGLFH